MRLDRLFAITMALLNGCRRVSAQELADRFEVSLRTVYRDIETLNQSGIPVVSYPGPDGGYEIMPSFRIDRQMLTLEQLCSLYTAVNGIQSTLDSAELTELLEKIGALVPEHAGRPISAGLNFQHAASGEEKAIIRSLHLGVQTLQLTSFNYMDHQGAETCRIVEPMGLFLKGSSWYLWAYCRVRDALRVFRLSRITNVHVLPQTFIRRKLSIEDVDKGRRTAERITVKLVFQPSVKARVRDEFEPDSIRPNDDGTSQVTAYYYTMEQAVRHIIGFADQAKVLEPPELMAAIRSQADRIGQLYRN